MKRLKNINPNWFWGFALLLFIAPEIVIWPLHHLSEALLEILETVLDEIVIHLFHTDRHTTQVIVFYLMFCLFAYLFYRSLRLCKVKYRYIKTNHPYWYKEIKLRWQQQSVSKKFELIAKCLGFLGVVFLLI